MSPSRGGAKTLAVEISRGMGILSILECKVNTQVNLKTNEFDECDVCGF